MAKKHVEIIIHGSADYVKNIENSKVLTDFDEFVNILFDKFKVRLEQKFNSVPGLTGNSASSGFNFDSVEKQIK